MIQKMINDNNGSLEFMSADQILSLGMDPTYAKTNAIKINGEPTSLFDINRLLLDGDFVSALKDKEAVNQSSFRDPLYIFKLFIPKKDGKINIEINKDHELVKNGFIPLDEITETEKLFTRQNESGSRFIDIGQHLVKSVISLPSGILKVPIGIFEEIINSKGDPAIEDMLKAYAKEYA